MRIRPQRQRRSPAMADTSHPIPYERTPIGPLQITVAVLIVITSLLPMPFPLLALGGLAGLVLTPIAGWLVLAFWCVVAALSGILDYYPVQAGPINVYAIDFIAVVFFWTLVHAIVAHNRTGTVPAFDDFYERRLIILWSTWCALGALFLLYGFIIKDYPADRAFGDFRRKVWYASVFFVPVFFPYNKRHLAALKYLIVIAGIVTIAIGAYRITTGTPARFDENMSTGHLGARWLWIVECMTLSTLLAYLVLVLRTGTGVVQKAIAIPLCFPAVGLMLVSGWRLAMAYAIAAPVVALILWTWARREPLRNIVVGGIAAIIAAVIPLLTVPLLFPDFFGRMMLDLRMRVLNDAVRGGFRTWAWAQGLNDFAESPIIGKGFGYYITIAMRNQVGLFYYVEQNNAHNLFVTVLYQTGLLGFIPFALFHIFFVVFALQALRRQPAAQLPVFIALFVTYLCYLGYGLTQPFVSSQFIIVYFTMGLVVHMARTAKSEA